MEERLDDQTIARVLRMAGVDVPADRLAIVAETLAQFQPLVDAVMSADVGEAEPEMRFDPRWGGDEA